MPSTPSANRSSTTSGRIALLLLALAAAALVASAAGAKGRHHRKHFDPAGFMEHHAERLGLSDATLESIEAIVEASRDEARPLRERHRAARERLKELLRADAPDEGLVMDQAEVVGGLETELDKIRLRSLIRIRELLTPEQLRELEAIRKEGPYARFKAARKACAEDVERLCPDGPEEGRRALFCLKDQRAQVSEPCDQALEALPKHKHKHRWKRRAGSQTEPSAPQPEARSQE